MYAVIKTGGKQHKVQAGDVIEVEKLIGADETLTLSQSTLQAGTGVNAWSGAIGIDGGTTFSANASTTIRR